MHKLCTNKMALKITHHLDIVDLGKTSDVQVDHDDGGRV